MTEKRILFVSWQGGLGHVTRDLAIVKELRKQNPEVQVSWLAHPLAAKILEPAGEPILPESKFSADYNEAAANAITGFKLNLVKYVKLSSKMFTQNAQLFREITSNHAFDLVVGDESFEVDVALSKQEFKLNCKMIMIEDFMAMASATNNPLEKLGIYQMNRARVKGIQHSPEIGVTHCFVGEIEDVPDKKFGLFLPNQREFAKKNYQFLGYIIRFNPQDYDDKKTTRAKLGYGYEPLIICATGGTAAGMEMLTKCGQAYNILKKEISNLHMVCVCGELYGRQPPQLPPGVELHHVIPNLFEHYAACDMAVVVGGMTTTIELAALRRPFIYFPLENQFDQQLFVSARLERFGAGVKMKFFQTTPQSLAQAIKMNIGAEAKWKPINTTGAANTAELITSQLA